MATIFKEYDCSIRWSDSCTSNSGVGKVSIASHSRWVGGLTSNVGGGITEVVVRDPAAVESFAIPLLEPRIVFIESLRRGLAGVLRTPNTRLTALLRLLTL